MFKKSLLLPLFILSVIQFGFGQEHDSHQIYNYVQSMEWDFKSESKPLFVKNQNRAIPADADQYVSKAEYLNLEESFAARIKKDKPKTMVLDIPIDGQVYQMQLYKKEVTTSSYSVKAASGAATQSTKSVFYRGIIKDKKESFVSLSMINSGIHMTITNEKGNYEINKIDDQLYAAYLVTDSKRSQDTGCSADQLLQNENVKVKTESDNRSTGDCIEIYIECDFDSYQKNGSSIENTEDWALAVMNEVGILYENEGVPLVVSEILVYDVPDPYLGGSTAGEMLSIMPSTINDYDGRLGHVFSTRSVGGGVAWLNVLCAQNNGNFGPFAVSGSMGVNVTPFPIYSWNVMVVAHELGHNIGSSHTHNCVWNGNNTQIDDCGSEGGDEQSCYDENDPILPNNGGTIMSYCHLIGGVGINFNNGFGAQPGALLLDKYLGANCVTGDDCFGSGEEEFPPVADFTFTQSSVCSPTEVQFTDLSTGTPIDFEWVMLGATPNFSTEQNPVVVYNEPGFFNVTLTVTNADGTDELTLNQIIEVIESPIPDFDFELIGDKVSFTNQTNLPVNTYFWDFGDGAASGEENPVYEYENEGLYIVSLTVDSSPCGMKTVQKSIDVFLPPTADFSVNNTFGCSPMTVSFSNNSSDNTEEYLWTFEGGTPASSTEENPTVVYDQAGEYDVVLMVSNGAGEDEITEITYISVSEAPNAGFNMISEVLKVDFENLSEGFDEISWDFGDGNISTEADPSHTYGEEDIYQVILTVINACDTVIMIQSINLNTSPTAGFISNDTEGCLPFTVDYTNNSSINTDTWAWSFPGGTPATSTEENPIVIYETAGTYDVTLIVSNETGEDSDVITDLIVVSDVPTIDFDFEKDAFDVDFIDLSSNYESLSWDFGDGNTSIEANPNHTYTDDGTYTVILSATNMCGTIKESKTIVISTLPVADYAVSQTGGCIPFVVEYTDNSSTNVTAWQWSFSGGNPSESTDQNPTVSYDAVGIYDVTLVVTSLAGEDVLETESYITTQDIPTAKYEIDQISNFEFTFNNISIDANSYSWDFGDSNTSIDENPNHIYADEGVYTVVLSATNECGTITYQEEVTVTGPTSIDKIDILSAVNINPNPNNGDFVLSMNAIASGEVRIEIYNIMGQQVKADNFQISSGHNNKAIELGNQTSGAYLILLKKGDQRQIIKFLIH